MRHRRHDEILSSAYSARIEAVEALRAGQLPSRGNAERIRAAATKLQGAGLVYNGEVGTHPYEMLSDLMAACALLIEWRDGICDAVADADRFLRAAKERCRIWREAHQNPVPPPAFVQFADAVQQVAHPSDVASLLLGLACAPIPIGVYVREEPPGLRARSQFSSALEESSRSDLMVAFVKFTINGCAASDLHFVQPGEVHDLDIEVRVSQWPKGADVLELRPITAEPSAIYDLPVFRIPAPPGTAPYVFHERGRAILNVPQSLHARPFEFKYAAEFKPTNVVAQPVYVEGHRTLRLEAVDWRTRPLSGYPAIDQKIIQIRDQLRRVPGLPANDIMNAIRLLTGLGNLAGQAVQEAWFGAGVDEARFHEEARRWLRGRPEIGYELEDHPHAAGGITDLSFHGIRLELKAEPTQAVSLKNCEQYLGQTASYAVGTSKRIAVLCVLNSSQKKEPPFPAEDGMTIMFKPIDQQSTIVIPTVLIQGGLARPSALKGK